MGRQERQKGVNNKENTERKLKNRSEKAIF